MALVSLGLITVAAAGTPQQVSEDQILCNSIFVQQNANNSGAIYVGSVDMDTTTLEGVLAVLPAPGDALPAYSAGSPINANGINLQDVYLDVENDGESALVSYYQA